ncbi:MAG: hypothetical protein M1133_11280 [Armatimonadetes bacterium]|nr:hypothetical protein [Armatimonadota bacterium]
MNDSKNPIGTLVHFIIGLIVLIVVFQILGGLLRLISGLVTTVLTLVLLGAIFYLVYLVAKWAIRNL